jgi:hypothetical protein
MVWLKEMHEKRRDCTGKDFPTEDIPDHWVFELCPLSSILKTEEHNVSETGSVSVLR